MSQAEITILERIRLLLVAGITAVVGTVDATSSGTITTQNLVPAGAATANSSVAITLNGDGTVAIQVTGTWTGALNLQATVDGTNWITLTSSTTLTQLSAGTLSANIASGSQDIYQVSVSGYAQLRVSGFGAITGTATITLRATVIPSSKIPYIGNVGQIDGNSAPSNLSGVVSFMQAYDGVNNNRIRMLLGSLGVLATPYSGRTTSYITTATTTAVKASAGVVGTITNAKHAATSLITVYDSLSASGNIVWSGTLADGQILPLGIPCATGITIVTAGADPIAVSFG